jgi:hypothetical protein
VRHLSAKINFTHLRKVVIYATNISGKNKNIQFQYRVHIPSRKFQPIPGLEPGLWPAPCPTQIRWRVRGIHLGWRQPELHCQTPGSMSWDVGTCVYTYFWSNPDAAFQINQDHALFWNWVLISTTINTVSNKPLKLFWLDWNVKMQVFYRSTIILYSKKCIHLAFLIAKGPDSTLDLVLGLRIHIHNTLKSLIQVWYLKSFFSIVPTWSTWLCHRHWLFHTRSEEDNWLCPRSQPSVRDSFIGTDSFPPGQKMTPDSKHCFNLVYVTLYSALTLSHQVRRWHLTPDTVSTWSTWLCHRHWLFPTRSEDDTWL